MLTGITSTSSTSTASTAAGAASNASATDEAQDRFLKLLVAQLNNQDPMNPLDNAQMTSQMAQINTVSGINQVNETLKGLASQFTALQLMQGSSLVGHDVLVAGNQLSVDDNDQASGAIDLAGRAESVKMDILSPGGQVVDTLNLGALDAGRHSFDWDASGYAYSGAPSVRVTATLGGQAIEATPLVRGQVTSVGLDNGAMSIQLKDRSAVAYTDIQAIL